MLVKSKRLPADGTAATRLEGSSSSRNMECCPSPESPPPSTTNYNLLRYRYSNNSSSDSIEMNSTFTTGSSRLTHLMICFKVHNLHWSDKLLVQIMHRFWLNLGQTWIGTSNVCDCVSPLRHKMNHSIYSQILYKPFVNAQDSIQVLQFMAILHLLRKFAWLTVQL